MALDFGTLGGDFDTVPATEPTASTGKPLNIPIADIAENPDNPRTEFDDEHIAELAADIAANGVKSPVSIRVNPTGQTPYMLNYGACRRLASIKAGKETIPAFIDEQFTEYDAVAENEQRRNLSAMELALFIKKRLDLGDKQKDIATRLHKDAQAITHHLALIDMPEAVTAAYRDGRVTTARTIYELVKLHSKHGSEVDKWCADNDSITRGSVRALADSLKQPEEQQDLPLVPPKPEAEPNTPSNNSTPEKVAQSPKTKPKSQPSDIARFADIPAMVVTVDSKRAVIVLERKPTSQGLVWVRYLDSGNVVEVEACKCALVELVSESEITNEVEA